MEKESSRLRKAGVVVPAAVAAVLITVVVFVAIESVEEAKASSSKKISKANGDVTFRNVVLDSSLNGSIALIDDIQKTVEKSSGNSYDPSFNAARTAATNGDTLGVSTALLQVHSAVIKDSVIDRGQVERLGLCVAWEFMLEKIHALGQADTWPAHATVEEVALIAGGHSDFKTFTRTASMLKESWQAELTDLSTTHYQPVSALAPAIVPPSSINTPYDDVSKEARSRRVVLQRFSEKLENYRKSTAASESSTFGATLAFQIIIVVLGIGFCAGMILLMRNERAVSQESRVIDRDFLCTKDKLKLTRETLNSVEKLSSAVTQLREVPAAGESTGQIEQTLRLAVEPVSMLRPFVPATMFVKSLRSESNMTSRNHDSLNLHRNLKKRPMTTMYIGFRGLTHDKESLADGVLNTFLLIAERAVSHFKGNIVQIGSTGLLATFSRASVEDGDEEHLEDGEILATHAAFAIISLTEEELGDTDLRLSIAISASIGLQGIQNFFVSTQYALISPAIASCLDIEPLNEVHDCMIVTDKETNDLISDHFLTKPIHFLPEKGSVYSVVLEEPAEDHPQREAVLREQEKVREKVTHWTKAWIKYEAVVSTERPSYEMLEEAYRDLEGYKIICAASDADEAFSQAMNNLKKLLSGMGITLAGTVDED